MVTGVEDNVLTFLSSQPSFLGIFCTSFIVVPDLFLLVIVQASVSGFFTSSPEFFSTLYLILILSHPSAFIPSLCLLSTMSEEVSIPKSDRCCSFSSDQILIDSPLLPFMPSHRCSHLFFPSVFISTMAETNQSSSTSIAFHPGPSITPTRGSKLLLLPIKLLLPKINWRSFKG